MSEELPYLEDLITVSLAAEILGVSRQTVHKMTRPASGRPPRLKAWRIQSVQEDPVVVLHSQVMALKARTRRPAVVNVLG